MGNFSWSCTVCDKSIMSNEIYEHPDVDWRSKAVCLLPGDIVFAGSYNGYGQIGETDISKFEGPELQHIRCWEERGNPSYIRPSDPAEDQGCFFDIGFEGDEDAFNGFEDELEKMEEDNIKFTKKTLGIKEEPVSKKTIPAYYSELETSILVTFTKKAGELTVFWNNTENLEAIQNIPDHEMGRIGSAWARIHTHFKDILYEMEQIKIK